MNTRLPKARGPVARALWPLLLGSGVLLAACSEAPADAPPEDSPEGPAISSPAFVFTEVATQVGLTFVHQNGARGDFNYPEMMQGGVALLDFDDDSWLDVYLVQSGTLEPDAANGNESFHNMLFHNRGDGTFENVSEESQTDDAGYGSAAAVGDIDGDGRVDLYVTNLGRNRMLRNRGDGSFEDWTERSGTAGSNGDYSTSASFFDYDRDGDLDLFVANYVAWSARVEHRCLGPHGVRGYCNPAEYEAQTDLLYRNRGDGIFEDVSRSSGIALLASNGLGVVTADLDNDGWVDIYVANDQLANHLWRNQGDGTFMDEALLRGAALNEMGLPEAGMGVIAEDPDNDGDWDLFMTHLSHETNTFYRNDGRGLFTDTTDSMQLSAVSQPFTGFGTGMFDFDLDGTLDLFISNGKVSPADAGDPSFAEPNQFLRGLADGRFEPVSYESHPEVSRGAAFGDIDNDGDIDIVVVNNNGPARLLRNDSPRAGNWLAVATREPSGAPAYGAVVEATTRDGSTNRVRRRQVQPASSYCTSNSPITHFGLAEGEEPVTIEVIWADGSTERREIEAMNQLQIFERQGGS